MLAGPLLAAQGVDDIGTCSLFTVACMLYKEIEGKELRDGVSACGTCD